MIIAPVADAARYHALHPRFPRACFSRITQVQRAADSITLALGPALPDRATGGNSASSAASGWTSSTSAASWRT